MNKISIVGTVGVPASYGGFETLVQNLCTYHYNFGLKDEVTIYCSRDAYKNHPSKFLNCNLIYLGFSANGIQSILYDFISIFSSIIRGGDAILILGVSGALSIPLIKLISNTRVICNIDGIEWKREKWGRVASKFLKISENIAVSHSDIIIADNEGIADYIYMQYKKKAVIIEYGGDSKPSSFQQSVPSCTRLPERFYLSLCRIEPENNIEMILGAFLISGLNLVFVGNWEASAYSKNLYKKYGNNRNIILLKPIYDSSELYYIRSNAVGYVHGHSKGGTNPSLVEMMHFNVPIYAYDCVFNRYTTENLAIFFNSTETLVEKLKDEFCNLYLVANNLKEVAERRYTWNNICKKYFDLLQV